MSRSRKEKSGWKLSSDLFPWSKGGLCGISRFDRGLFLHSNSGISLEVPTFHLNRSLFIYQALSISGFSLQCQDSPKSIHQGTSLTRHTSENLGHFHFIGYYSDQVPIISAGSGRHVKDCLLPARPWLCYQQGDNLFDPSLLGTQGSP